MNETIGVRLKQAREKRHLTLQQASEATKVRTHYLQALETDDLSTMPSAAQARGFLRLYVEFLGLNLADLSASPTPPEVGAGGDAKPVAPAPAGPPAAAASDVPPSSTAREAIEGKPRVPGFLVAFRNRLVRRTKVEPEASQAAPIASEASSVQIPGPQAGPSILQPIVPAASGPTVPEMAAVSAFDGKGDLAKNPGTRPHNGDSSTDGPDAEKKNESR